MAWQRWSMHARLRCTHSVSDQHSLTVLMEPLPLTRPNTPYMTHPTPVQYTIKTSSPTQHHRCRCRRVWDRTTLCAVNKCCNDNAMWAMFLWDVSLSRSSTPPDSIGGPRFCVQGSPVTECCTLIYLRLGHHEVMHTLPAGWQGTSTPTWRCPHTPEAIHTRFHTRFT